jgi:hypothetical protein
LCVCWVEAFAMKRRIRYDDESMYINYLNS